jgi:DNA-binding transcriptional MocR family regulator
MSIQAMTWAYEQDLSPTYKFVLVTLANYATSHEAHCTCFPGQKTLARDTGMDERTVRRALKFLEDMGFIDRMRRCRKDGTRTSDETMLMVNRALCPVGQAEDFSGSLPGVQSEPTGPTARAINRKGNVESIQEKKGSKEKEKRGLDG